VVDSIFKLLAQPTRLVTLASLLTLGCDAGPSAAPAAAKQSPAATPRADEMPEEEEALVTTPVTPVQYLRQLTFDLRGGPPTAEELAQVAAAGSVPQELVDALLQSEGFLAQVRTWHAEILWPNLQRYRLQAESLGAVYSPSDDPKDIGTAEHGSVGADPLLIVDAEAREKYTVAIESEAVGGSLRGGGHAHGTHYCDFRDEAEYPDPSVVGTPANTYEVPPERSGTGQGYTAKYYSEDPASLGAVMPIRDYQHCANWCRRDDCAPDQGFVDENADNAHDCFTWMDAPGDDPNGRHELDVPGMRCKDGFTREVNVCNFWEFLGPDGWAHRAQNFGANGRMVSVQQQREGWRWKEHYWTKGVKVKTCAVEAQDRELGLYNKNPDGTALACSKVMATGNWWYLDPSCGCGPNGAYCQPSHTEYATYAETRSENRLRRALEEEPLQIIRSVVERDEDYLSILTTTRSFVNGPLAFAFLHQSQVLRGEGKLRISPPGPVDPVWSMVPFESDEWVETSRPSHHAGILTTLGWLIRFPTYRARIAQYRRKFLCSAEFDYAPQPDPADHNPDIAERSGCSNCHARLELDGMYYGRYPDRTGLYLDPEKFPIVNEACRYCAVGDPVDPMGHGHPGDCELGKMNPKVPGGVVTDPDLDFICRNWYGWWDYGGALPEQADYGGMLWATVYRDEELFDRVDAGPAAMVEADQLLGPAMSECTVETTWRRLVRRDISPEELAALTAKFEASGRKYRSLIRDIVLSEPYRSVTR